MKRFSVLPSRRLLPATAIVLLALAAATSGAGADVFPFPHRLVQLDNGLKAYLIQAGAPGQIAYMTVVRTGSRDEWEPGHSGFAHFFEHMMFRGTEKHPVYDAVTETFGADHNASTGNDQTIFYMVAPADFLEEVVDLESDRFMNLHYSEADFRTEAGAVLGEFQQSRFSPYRFMSKAVRDLAFEKHTYKHTTIGFEADVRAMPEGYDYSLSFHDRYYRPENCVILLVGDFDPDLAEQLIHEYYDGWQRGYVPPRITPEPPQTAPRRETLDYPGRTLPTLSLNWKAPAWSATDRVAVAAQVLGEIAFGENSDLYRRLVLDEQRVQSLRSDFGLGRDPYLLNVTAVVPDRAGVDGVEADIAATAARFRDETCDPQRLADVKSHMKYGFLMRLETASGIAFSLVRFVVPTGGIEAVEDYYATLDAVTPEDVREAARRYLVDTGLTEVTMVQKEGDR